jgi:hypothetical protein
VILVGLIVLTGCAAPRAAPTSPGSEVTVVVRQTVVVPWTVVVPQTVVVTATPPPTLEDTPVPKATTTATMPPEQAQMAASVEVRLQDMQVLPIDYDASRYQQEIQITLVYRNLGKKDIRAFTGVTTFADVFDRPKKTINLTVDEPLAAGQTTTDSGRIYKPNQFMADDQWLLTTDVTNIKFTFRPTSIIFTDGTQLGKP